MTPEEAIENLEILQGKYWNVVSPLELRALELGIEALKAIKAERTIHGFKRLARLPGETEERHESDFE